jgi:hypothetical protein
MFKWRPLGRVAALLERTGVEFLSFGVILIVIPEAKPNLPLRNRRERLHFLHLMGKAVDVLDENFNYGCRAVVTALRFLDAGGDVPVVLHELTHARRMAIRSRRKSKPISFWVA